MGRSAAERQRDCRARRACGLGTFHLTLDEVAVAEMLIAGGLLAPQDADDHRKVVFAHAVAKKRPRQARVLPGGAPAFMSAFAVAIGGKADMTFCGAHVRF